MVFGEVVGGGGGGGGEGGDGKWGYRGGWVKVRKGRLGVSFFLFFFGWLVKVLRG